MVRRTFIAILSGVFLITIFFSISTAQTPQDAKVMVEKALAYYNSNGKDKTIEEVKNPKGQFVKGDVYVNIYTLKGVMLANPVSPKLIGMNGIELKDPDGKYFMKELCNRAASEGSGWVDYKWTNPTSKKIEPKTTYFQKAGDIIISSGVYKK
jgi:cytochrome c